MVDKKSPRGKGSSGKTKRGRSKQGFFAQKGTWSSILDFEHPNIPNQEFNDTMTANRAGREMRDDKYEDPDSKKQAKILKAFMGTVQHYFGSWEKIFSGVRDTRNQLLITYPMAALMCVGILMFEFRLGARREITHKLRGSKVAEKKFKALSGKFQIRFDSS